MKGRNVVITLLLVVALLLLAVLRRWREPRVREPFNRSANTAYSAYAICQLQCKGIDRTLVKEVMQKGMVIYNKSNPRRWPCPTYVVQSRTKSGRYLRVVFEQCDKKTTILAVDDVEQIDSCNCSGER